MGKPAPIEIPATISQHCPTCEHSLHGSLCPVVRKIITSGTMNGSLQGVHPNIFVEMPCVEALCTGYCPAYDATVGCKSLEAATSPVEYPGLGDMGRKANIAKAPSQCVSSEFIISPQLREI